MSEITEYLLLPFSSWQMMLVTLVSTFAGIYIGAIPGLSGTMGVSLLVSLTYGWSPNVAYAALVGVYSGSVFGGSRAAILLNIPGAPAAVATVFDGYPMALKGKAGLAMGVTTIESVIGGILGIIAMAVFTPLLSKFAIKFGPTDYFLLAIMGLLLVGSLGSGNMVKGIIPAIIGLLMGCVGMDDLTGYPRFSFGVPYLLSGITIVACMVGLYGISEAFAQIQDKDLEIKKQEVHDLIPPASVIIKYLPLTLRCSLIGTVVGALPGSGGSIAALLAYDHAKRTVKNPEVPFGEGAIEGLVAPESSNNAAVGGAFIPMLTLGVPGDGVTAIIMGAFVIHGLNPGPTLMLQAPHIFYMLVVLLILTNVYILLFGLTGIKLFSKLCEIPKGRLCPIIIILCVIGAYAINTLRYDIFWCVGCGLLGYFLKKYDYSVAPMVLGLILADTMENNLRRAIVTNRGFWSMIRNIFSSPISLVLFTIIVVSIVAQTDLPKRVKSLLQTKRKSA